MIIRARIIISSLYDLINQNSDFSFIKDSFINLGSVCDELLHERHELYKLELRTRKLLNEFSETVEQMGTSIALCKIGIKREEERKKEDRKRTKEERRKNRMLNLLRELNGLK